MKKHTDRIREKIKPHPTESEFVNFLKKNLKLKKIELHIGEWGVDKNHLHDYFEIQFHGNERLEKQFKVLFYRLYELEHGGQRTGGYVEPLTLRDVYERYWNTKEWLEKPTPDTYYFRVNDFGLEQRLEQLHASKSILL